MVLEVDDMSVVIRAHFDGKVIVPDEPVDLPVNEPLEFDLRPTPTCLPWDPSKADEAWEWMKSHPINGLSIPDEALRRENLYEDRGL
jgi:hypothetical protein